MFLHLNASSAFITVSELKEQFNSKELIIIDVATSDIYATSHIDGALNIDVAQLSRSSEKGTVVSSQDKIQQELSTLGINENSHVVIYSHNINKSILDSSFLAMILISHGFSNVSILDGGFLSWIFENELLISNKKVTLSKETTFKFKKIENLFINSQYIQNNLNATIIDSRSEQHYFGLKRSDKSERVGHISSAISSYYKNNFLVDSSLRNSDDLNKIFTIAMNLENQSNIIVYSDTIYTASVNWYILYHHMGYKNTKIYEASFYEWGNNLELPITTFQWE